MWNQDQTHVEYGTVQRVHVESGPNACRVRYGPACPGISNNLVRTHLCVHNIFRLQGFYRSPPCNDVLTMYIVCCILLYTFGIACGYITWQSSWNRLLRKGLERGTNVEDA